MSGQSSALNPICFVVASLSRVGNHICYAKRRNSNNNSCNYYYYVLYFSLSGEGDKEVKTVRKQQSYREPRSRKKQPQSENIPMRILQRIKQQSLILIGLPGLLMFGTTPAYAFNFDTGNAAIEVVIDNVAPVIFQDISRNGGDAPLVLRLTTMITNSWYDASAPYDPDEKALGVYTHLAHQASGGTNAEMNIALLYASYQVLNSLLPHRATEWDKMLTDVGLDPNDPNINDLNTPEGIGTAAGIGVVAGRLYDGMNQTGDADGRSHNPSPYTDYTNYSPVNTAYRLRNSSRWQPDLQRQGMGLYKIQQFVTPQYALTEPYSYPDPKAFSVPPPSKSQRGHSMSYRQQADEVLQASADLDDVKKMKAELFDNKILGLGFSAVHAAFSQGLSLFEFIKVDFLTNMAAFDAGIFVWQEKRIHDAVRPFSAIKLIYGNEEVTAWGGPGNGTVDLPASEWISYLEEADHPEYPSASTCFCYAHAQAARRFLPAGNSLNWTVPQLAGSSRTEPGITPTGNIDLVFDTWTDFAEDCGQSRVWAGVHFQSAVDESAKICGTFGDIAYDYLTMLVNGDAPLREPSQGLGD